MPAPPSRTSRLGNNCRLCSCQRNAAFRLPRVDFGGVNAAFQSSCHCYAETAPRTSAGGVVSSLSPPASSHLFIRRHIDDFELFGVERRVRAEGEFAKIALLHLDQ